MKLSEATKLLLIDDTILAKECKTHSAIYNDILTEYTKSVSIRDQLKDKKDQVWATEFLKCKSDTTKKVTDTEAKSLTETSKAYLEATDNYYKAKDVSDQWENLRNSYFQRGSMLKIIANLQIASLYNNSIGMGNGFPAITKNIQYDTMREEVANERLQRSKD
jgi:hypothetical protein